jgi:penicillin-binding protein 1A
MGGMSGTSSRLRGFVGNANNDTDFGGKTGTSNNHSDAWFIGTTPRLVCGAWVGGEYRCIHFRTGQLGQGNRTALPICGYFLGSVLNDKQFSQYRTRFQKPDNIAVFPGDYNCGGYFMAPADSDSLAVDSLGTEEIDMVVDEFGNVVPVPKEHNEEVNQQPQPDEPQEALEPKEE